MTKKVQKKFLWQQSVCKSVLQQNKCAQIIQKITSLTRNFSGYPENFRIKNIQPIRKLSRLYGNFPDHPKNIQTIWKVSRQSRNFPVETQQKKSSLTTKQGKKFIWWKFKWNAPFFKTWFLNSWQCPISGIQMELNAKKVTTLFTKCNCKKGGNLAARSTCFEFNCILYTFCIEWKHLTNIKNILICNWVYGGVLLDVKSW